MYWRPMGPLPPEVLQPTLTSLTRVPEAAAFQLKISSRSEFFANADCGPGSLLGSGSLLGPAPEKIDCLRFPRRNGWLDDHTSFPVSAERSRDAGFCHFVDLFRRQFPLSGGGAGSTWNAKEFSVGLLGSQRSPPGGGGHPKVRVDAPRKAVTSAKGNPDRRVSSPGFNNTFRMLLYDSVKTSKSKGWQI